MNVPFPLHGIDKGRVTSEQPEFTSPDIKNMRPFGTLDNRMRGGQRPALDKAYAQQISSAANPILIICSVTYTEAV